MKNLAYFVKRFALLACIFIAVSLHAVRTSEEYVFPHLDTPLSEIHNPGKGSESTLVISYPEGFDPTKTYPVALWLNGGVGNAKLPNFSDTSAASTLDERDYVVISMSLYHDPDAYADDVVTPKEKPIFIEETYENAVINNRNWLEMWEVVEDKVPNRDVSRSLVRGYSNGGAAINAMTKHSRRLYSRDFFDEFTYFWFVESDSPFADWSVLEEQRRALWTGNRGGVGKYVVWSMSIYDQQSEARWSPMYQGNVKGHSGAINEYSFPFVKAWLDDRPYAQLAWPNEDQILQPNEDGTAQVSYFYDYVHPGFNEAFPVVRVFNNGVELTPDYVEQNVPYDSVFSFVTIEGTGAHTLTFEIEYADGTKIVEERTVIVSQSYQHPAVTLASPWAGQEIEVGEPFDVYAIADDSQHEWGATRHFAVYLDGEVLVEIENPENLRNPKSVKWEAHAKDVILNDTEPHTLRLVATSGSGKATSYSRVLRAIERSSGPEPDPDPAPDPDPTDFPLFPESAVPIVSERERIAYAPFDLDMRDSDGNLRFEFKGKSALILDSDGSETTRGAVRFDGGRDRVVIPNSPVLNTGKEPIAERTFSLWFLLDDAQAATRQPLFESGGTRRGFNAYVEAGSLFVGLWDNSGTDGDGKAWQGTWRSISGIESGRWYHVALVLDASADPGVLHAGAFSAYLDGVEFDPRNNKAMQIARHDGKSALGGIEGNTSSPTGDFSGSMTGFVDDFAVWNRALSQSEVMLLAGGSATSTVELVSSVDQVAWITMDNTVEDALENLRLVTRGGASVEDGFGQFGDQGNRISSIHAGSGVFE